MPYHTISHQDIPYHTIKLSTPVSSSKVLAPEQEICRLYRIHRIYRINKTRAKQESRCRIYTKHAHDIYLGETIFSTVLRTLPWEQACCDIRSKDTFSKFGKNGFNSITYWENFLGVKTEEKTVCYQNHLSGRSDIDADFNDENLTSKLSFWHDRNWPQLIRLRKWVCSMFMVTFCEITIDKIGKMVTLVTILIELPEWSCTGKDQQWWWWSRLLWQWQPWL